MEAVDIQALGRRLVGEPAPEASALRFIVGQLKGFEIAGVGVGVGVEWEKRRALRWGVVRLLGSSCKLSLERGWADSSGSRNFLKWS